MTDEIRLNRFLADSGICSRREADQLIADEKVTVNGTTASLGMKIDPSKDRVLCKGSPVRRRDLEKRPYVYIALNKPKGITCTSDTRRRDNIIDYLNFDRRIFTIGRLDRDSEGLILLTDNGGIVNKILRAGNRHEKEYLVSVDRPYDAHFLQQMEEGVYILGQKTLPARCRRVSSNTFRICLHQGLNRQIRRMCSSLGYEVTRLTRTRIMNIALSPLKTGEWRYLSPKEVDQLMGLLSSSGNKSDTPVMRKK